MSSNRNAFSGLKPKTLPMIELVRFAMEPSSKRLRSYAIQPIHWPGALGTGSIRKHLAWYCSWAVSLSVQTTVHVAVLDSPATAAAASSGATPGCGVMRKAHRTSVSFGT